MAISRMIRATWVAAALLVTFFQASSAGHMLLVRHARCAEHGELVHESHHELPRLRGTVHGDVSTAMIGLSDSRAAAHAHCVLASDRHEGLAAVPNAQIVPVPPCGASSWARSSDRELRDDSRRFRLAPKASPPV